jgi:hypothetical protein
MPVAELSEPIANLTVGDLKALIRESVAEALVAADPDAGLTLRPQVVARLQESMLAAEPRMPSDDFWRAVESDGPV